jgi:hypothetical protein
MNEKAQEMNNNKENAKSDIVRRTESRTELMEGESEREFKVEDEDDADEERNDFVTFSFQYLIDFG